MNKSIKLMTSLGVIFVLAFSTAAYSRETPLYVPGIRPLAMGGAFLALADDQNAFFYNPAGLSQRIDPSFSFFELNLLINTNSYDLGSRLVGAVTGTEDSLGDPLAFMNELIDNYLNKKFRFYVAPALNLSIISPPLGYFSVGIGIFIGATNANISIPSSGLFPDIDISATIDSAVIIPMCYELGESIVLGVSAKGIVRNKSELYRSFIELVDFETSKLIDLPNLLTGWGYGVDVGLLFHLGNQLTLGATYKDVGGTKINYDREVQSIPPYAIVDVPLTVETIPERINLGLSYIFNSEQLPMGDNVIFCMQYNDLMGHLEETDRGVPKLRIKNIHLGFEMGWNMLSIRLGLNQGYLTTGFGFFMGPLNIDYAYYGEEMGLYAGALPQWNHFFSFAVRFN